MGLGNGHHGDRGRDADRDALPDARPEPDLPGVGGYVDEHEQRGRSGAAEVVYVGNPMKLGYLTVWAANYRLTSHHFKPGAYQVGGPIGRVWYYAKHRELRLGQPLTITKANVDFYKNKF